MTQLEPDAVSGDVPFSVGDLADFARSDTGLVSSVFCSHDVVAELHGTRTNLRVNWVPSDANGRPLVSDLVKALVSCVVDYCIPRERIEEARQRDAQNRSTSRMTALAQEASEKFFRGENSGEGGEVLLYFLLEVGLGIPQLLSKMSHKTSGQMHSHGVDGVHAAAIDDQKIAVYWGESKLYGSISSGLTDCLTSIRPYLEDPGGGALSEDIWLVRDNVHQEFGNLGLQLARYFTEGNTERQLVEARGCCVVGFTHDTYPELSAKSFIEASSQLEATFQAWQTAAATRVRAQQLESFEIEFFLVPLPSVVEFREMVQRYVGATR